MSHELSERAYAKHRGCSRSSVQAARQRGRLQRSVRTDEAGRIWIDPELADMEWRRNTDPSRVPITGPTAPRPRLGDAPPPAAVAELEQRLREIVAADCDETKRFTLELIAPLVAGAVEELRSGGRNASAEALAEALRLDDQEDEDAGIEASTALMEIICGAANMAEAARAAGREIASGRWWRTQEGNGDGE